MDVLTGPSEELDTRPPESPQKQGVSPLGTPGNSLPSNVSNHDLAEPALVKVGLRRARSSLRQRYEAEASVIERRIGGLEKARETLGLSQRKMAQLLLVDPSAWTRWTQDGQGAPPHIWRALAWYLALQDKYPALDAAFWLQGVARSADGDRISQNADEIRAAKLHARSLEIKIQDLTREIAQIKQTVPVDSEVAKVLDAGTKRQAETRAIANFFLALTFAALGFAIAAYFMRQ